MNTLAWAELQVITAIITALYDQMALASASRSEREVERLHAEIITQERIHDSIVARITERILQAA
jgi:hypothetical protein